jgi:hypothetical protein
MKWLTFFQVIALIMISSVSFYIVYPKYEFHYKVNADGELCLYNANKITGDMQVMLRDKPFK